MLNLNQGLSIHKDLHENNNEAFQTFDYFLAALYENNNKLAITKEIFNQPAFLNLKPTST